MFSLCLFVVSFAVLITAAEMSARSVFFDLGQRAASFLKLPIMYSCSSTSHSWRVGLA